jgi:phosphohistidine phosphatase
MSVELYLIRHGIAAERGETYPDDTKRPLTQRGLSRLQKEARGLAALGVTFDQILTSPLVRTRQTADILADAFPAPVASLEALAPEGTSAAVIEELGRYSRRSRIALVGHEPNIGELAARLAGAKTPFAFKKGAVCCIELAALPPARPGRLLWFATPRMLRALGR